MSASDLGVRLATAADIPGIRELWDALYRHQAAHGMALRVPPDGFDLWAKTIVPALGRFAVVAIARGGGEDVAFAAGRVRTLPAYFGGGVAGTIGEVFVAEPHRRAGIGRRVLAPALDWFTAQGIARVELQVASGNPEAVRFYEALGWTPELVQLVWQVPEVGQPMKG
jgi:GNAT superfamily N-acetyltransferase